MAIRCTNCGNKVEEKTEKYICDTCGVLGEEEVTENATYGGGSE
jgi:rRNA maturation endonuclease Nob1